MAKTPSRAPLIAAIILVLAVLAGFNALNEKYRPKSEHEMEAAQAEAAKAAQSKGGEAGKSAIPVAAPTASGDPASLSLAQLGPDALVGDKDGINTITIGWSWTPDVQGDPDKVARAIDLVEKAAPNAKIRVVNTDEVSGVPDGISANGKVLVSPAADGGFPTEAGAYQGVTAIGKAGASVPPGPK